METIEQTSGVIPTFYMHSVKDEEASKKEGKAVFRQEEWVDLTFIGNPVKTVLPKRVDDLIRQNYSLQYRAWKDGIEPPKSGTPLAEWPAISRQQAEEFTNAGIATVEALSMLPESTVEQFAMGLTLQQKAKAFLDTASNVGTLSEELADLRKSVESLTGQVKARDEQIAGLVAMQDAQRQAAPKKPGRPRKTEAAA